MHGKKGKKQLAIQADNQGLEHPVVTELVPFRVGGCLLVTAPGRLIVQVGGLTLPFVPRLALGLPLALALVLALLRWCVVYGCPG